MNELPETEIDRLEYEDYIDQVVEWPFGHEIDFDEFHRFFTYNNALIEYLNREELCQLLFESLKRLEDAGQL